MSALRQIPIAYQGELHQVKLINFSVDANEVIPHVPDQLKVLIENGRAMISMVDVQLKNMRIKGFPEWLGFNYRHVAFRLLLDDTVYSNSDEPKGIFFLKSFTNKKWIAAAGDAFTHYKLSDSTFEAQEESLRVECGDRYVSYKLSKEQSVDTSIELKEKIGRIDRAYIQVNDQVESIVIAREKWPIQPIFCGNFENNFFRSANLEGAFTVKPIIYYTWKASRPIL